MGSSCQLVLEQYPVRASIWTKQQALVRLTWVRESICSVRAVAVVEQANCFLRSLTASQENIAYFEVGRSYEAPVPGWLEKSVREIVAIVLVFSRPSTGAQVVVAKLAADMQLRELILVEIVAAVGKEVHLLVASEVGVEGESAVVLALLAWL
jgi:hypothetical protein